MQLQQRINAFHELGQFLQQFSTKEFKKNDSVLKNYLENEFYR